MNITEKQYLEAVLIVKEYHKQIEDKINEIESKIASGNNNDKLLAIKVKCIGIKGSQGNYFPYITVGKIYDIVKSKYKTKFRIIADNGKKRTYGFDQIIWEFIYN